MKKIICVILGMVLVLLAGCHNANVDGTGASKADHTDSEANIHDMREDMLPYLESDKDAIHQTYSKLQSTLGSDENGSVSIDDNDVIKYRNSEIKSGEDDLGFSLTDDEAVDKALKILGDLGLAPEGSYRARVSSMNRAVLNLDGNQPSSPEAVEYTVMFYQTYNGLDIISDEEDGIIVTFDKFGLTSLNYKWRNMKFIEKSPLTSTELITKEQAEAIYIDTMCLAELYEGPAGPFIDQVYLQTDQEVRIVWVCALNDYYTNALFIDMQTGEPLSF